MTRTAEVVVVGAGFAGAATAWQLTRRGVRDVLVLEREAVPGVHASGRNAGIVRTTAVAPALEPLALEGAAFLSERTTPGGAPLVRRTGLLVLSGLADGRRHRRQPGRATWLDRHEIERRVSATRGGAFVGGVLGDEDGVADIAALLQLFLREAMAAGARVETSTRVLAVRTQHGRVTELTTNQGVVSAGALVNAAGAWASELGTMAGAASPALRPCRRHLFVTGAADWIDPSWPVVWDETNGLYFRPETPGLLMSACDQVPQEPGSVAVDPEATAALAAKVRHVMPRLSGLGVARVWAGLRTLTDDGAFVIGRDPLVENLTWCAGLGGLGMTTAAACGRLAAEAVLGQAAVPEHDPARFLRARRRSPSREAAAAR